jgi:outer membrane protein
MSRYLSAGALVLALIVLGVAAWSLMRQPDLGYIDSARLMQDYPGAQAAREKIQDRQRQWQANVQTLDAEAKALTQRLVQEGAGLTPARQAALRDTVNAKQRQLARYQRAVQQRAAELERELMQPVFDELNAEIKRYGEQAGYDLIFGTVAGGNILYAEAARIKP